MTKRPLKSWKTLASESKANRKTNLTPEQIKELNRHFEKIEKLQEQDTENTERKIAKQPQV